jgi:uncharacterized protein DUF3788
MVMTRAPFLDRTATPDEAQLHDALGPSAPRWDRLDGWVRDAYGLEGEWLWFGNDSGWCRRYRRSGRALCTLLPGSGTFRALVVIGPTAWEQVDESLLSPTVRAARSAAHPCPDGRWLWLAVDDDRSVEDIERLVALKSPPPRRPRRASGTLVTSR